MTSAPFMTLGSAVMKPSTSVHISRTAASRAAASILDIIVSYGERLSSVIISRVIEGAVHLDSRNFIKTEKQWDKHVLDNDATQVLIHDIFDRLDFKGTALDNGLDISQAFDRAYRCAAKFKNFHFKF